MYNFRSIPKADQSLLAHTKVYVLADRFNITTLKNLSFSKISALLENVGTPPDELSLNENQAIALISAATYACKKLLLSTTSITSSTSNPDLGPGVAPIMEPLLKFFAQYISWALRLFKDNEGLLKLLSNHPNLLQVVLSSCRPAIHPPWLISKSTSSQSVYLSDDKIPLSERLRRSDNPDHVLYRKCTNCDYSGLVGIQCPVPDCRRYDWDFGLRISKQSGTFSSQCCWCHATITINTDSSMSFEQTNGHQLSSTEVSSYRCSKCSCYSTLVIV